MEEPLIYKDNKKLFHTGKKNVFYAVWNMMYGLICELPADSRRVWLPVERRIHFHGICAAFPEHEDEEEYHYRAVEDIGEVGVGLRSE